MTQENRHEEVVIDKQHVKLDKSIGGGGTATIFSVLKNNNIAIKIYKPEALTKDLKNKLELMIKNPPNIPAISNGAIQIAWPETVAYSVDGEFCGFSMRKIDQDSATVLQDTLNRGVALQKGLAANLGSRVVLAHNLAIVCQALHDSGHYIVDLKPHNILFRYPALTIAIIDCDGFSIKSEKKRLAAGMITEHYLAPEFHGNKKYEDSPATQDQFALATIIHQLINFGLHPYDGRPLNKKAPDSRAAKIKGNYYAYGILPNRNIDPLKSSTHELVPKDIRDLFDRAFQKESKERPSASEWSTTLNQYIQKNSDKLLVECVSDKMHQRFPEKECPSCFLENVTAGKTSHDASTRPIFSQMSAHSSWASSNNTNSSILSTTTNQESNKWELILGLIMFIGFCAGLWWIIKNFTLSDYIIYVFTPVCIYWISGHRIIKTIASLFIILTLYPRFFPLESHDINKVASTESLDTSKNNILTYFTKPEEGNTVIRSHTWYVQEMIAASLRDDEAEITNNKQLLDDLPKPLHGDRLSARNLNKDALILIKQNEFTNAEVVLKKAYAADPSDIEISDNYGFVLLQNGALKKAETLFNAALLLNSDRASAWSGMGDIYALNGKSDKAVACYMNAYRFSKNRKNTHKYFQNKLYKENREDLRLALSGVIEKAEQTFIDPSDLGHDVQSLDSPYKRLFSN